MITLNLSARVAAALAEVGDLRDHHAIVDAIHWSGLSIFEIGFRNLMDAIDRELMRRAEETAAAHRHRIAA